MRIYQVKKLSPETQMTPIQAESARHAVEVYTRGRYFPSETRVQVRLDTNFLVSTETEPVFKIELER